MNKMQTKLNRSLRQEMNPVPTVSSIGSNPRAAPTAKSRWMRRSVRIRQTGTASANTTISFADIGAAMGALSSETYTVKVLGVRAWNVTPLATTDNRILASIGADIMTMTSSFVEAEDYGCGMQLPGVKINVPDILAKSNVTSASTSAFTIAASASVQQYLVDFDLMYQM